MQGKPSAKVHCGIRTVRLRLVATLGDELARLHSIWGTVEWVDAVAIVLAATFRQAVFLKVSEISTVFSIDPQSAVVPRTALPIPAAPVRRSRLILPRHSDSSNWHDEINPSSILNFHPQPE
jgi:hypothetical protein